MLSYIKKRLAVGFAFVAALLSTFFACWTFVNVMGGPIIGTLVFNVINISAVCVLGFYAFRKRPEVIDPNATPQEFEPI